MEIATKDELLAVKNEILNKLEQLIGGQPKPLSQYLKNKEVKQLLGCSDSKLETLRKNGSLPCSKIMGTYYYKPEDVKKLFEINTFN